MKAMTLVGTRRGTDGVWVNAIAMHEGAEAELAHTIFEINTECDRLESENDALHRHLVDAEQQRADYRAESLLWLFVSLWLTGCLILSWIL